MAEGLSVVDGKNGFANSHTTRESKTMEIAISGNAINGYILELGIFSMRQEIFGHLDGSNGAVASGSLKTLFYNDGTTQSGDSFKLSFSPVGGRLRATIWTGLNTSDYYFIKLSSGSCT